MTRLQKKESECVQDDQSNGEDRKTFGWVRIGYGDERDHVSEYRFEFLAEVELREHFVGRREEK